MSRISRVNELVEIVVGCYWFLYVNRHVVSHGIRHFALVAIVKGSPEIDSIHHGKDCNKMERDCRAVQPDYDIDFSSSPVSAFAGVSDSIIAINHAILVDSLAVSHGFC